ncbi:MAG: hypothetical protein AAF570_26120, partial [Bacteroidota bacterium]
DFGRSMFDSRFLEDEEEEEEIEEVEFRSLPEEETAFTAEEMAVSEALLAAEEGHALPTLETELEKQIFAEIGAIEAPEGMEVVPFDDESIAELKAEVEAPKVAKSGRTRRKKRARSRTPEPAEDGMEAEWEAFAAEADSGEGVAAYSTGFPRPSYQKNRHSASGCAPGSLEPIRAQLYRRYPGITARALIDDVLRTLYHAQAEDG